MVLCIASSSLLNFTNMHSTIPTASSQKLLHVDGLRGFACLMVVFSHLALIFYPGLHDPGLINDNLFISFIFNSSFSFLYSGTAAVYIFFTLSGFILSHAFMNGKDVLENVTSMVSKRYFRLAIPAIASCIFCFVVVTNTTPETGMLSGWIQSYKVANPSLFDAVYSGAVHAFFGEGSAYNPVLWTMKIELIGSFLTYFTCIILIKCDKKPLLLLFFGLMLFLSTLPQKEKYGYMAFLFGVYIYTSSFSIKKGTALVLAAIGVYAGGVHYGSSPYIYTIYYSRFFLNGEESNAYILFNFISGIVITFAILTNGTLKKAFSNKAFVYMGKVSFSVYLFHLPFLFVVAVWLFNAFYVRNLGYATSAISASLLSIGMIYGLANFIFKLVDYPSMKISNKISTFLFYKRERSIKEVQPTA
ncbi:Acyltransferase family [Pseudescherichia vulneris]|nr:Acyltransferase family [Pseudescherichia vulneris]